jgi:hypothetical protein
VTDETLVDALNRSCHCIAVDQGALQKSLATRLDESGILSRLQQTHPNLLADSPVFVSLDQIRQMKAVIAAIERIAGIERFREKVLQWAPDIAAANPGPQGVFFGYDFHLTNDGPRLIEVNTNAGGALLLLLVASAQKACCREVENFVAGRLDVADIERAFIDMFRDELQAQMPGRLLQRVGIVDENPAKQYLSPEFILFQEMFARHGIDAVIAGPEEFDIRSGRLHAHGKDVDLVYNRLTDFYLQTESCSTLNDAYRSGVAAFTPNPHTHALFANKRNLTILSNSASLLALGVDDETIKLLISSVPKTERVTPENADDLWARRRHLFFKPSWGHGSRGTYKGAKLTKKTWASILAADYVAQELVPPSERLVVIDGDRRSMKLDVRCYAYGGEIQLLGARMYRGQTTNFRTDGGGLAAVFTAPDI